MKKIIFGVIGLTFLAKIFGFMREILLSYYFGATGISDAYLISQTIPGTIFQFVGTGLTTCFIPVFLRTKAQKGKIAADKLSNTVISIVMVFSAVVIIGVWMFTKQIIGLFAAGFEGETLEYAIVFTRISTLSLFLSTMIYVFTSYLQANHSFWIVAFAAIPNSIVVMLSIVLAAKVNVVLLSVGSVCAIAVQLMVMYPALHKLKFRLKPSLEWKNENVLEVFKLMLPVIMGVSVNQINTLVDRTIASTISVGAISALMYADSLIQFVQGAFSQTIATVYYPTVTQMAEERQLEKLKEYIRQEINTLILLLCPITVGILLLSEDIISILYGRGAFSDTAVSMTSISLSCYALGIIGSGVREVLSRVFYAFQDTKTPMRNATIGLVMNIVLNLILSRFFGIGGLAFATALSSTLIAVLLWVRLRKKLGNFEDKKVWTDFYKILLSSIVMALGVILLKKMCPMVFGEIVSLGICVIFGAAIFGVLACLLRVEGVQELQKIVRDKKHKRK